MKIGEKDSELVQKTSKLVVGSSKYFSENHKEQIGTAYMYIMVLSKK